MRKDVPRIIKSGFEILVVLLAALAIVNAFVEFQSAQERPNCSGSTGTDLRPNDQPAKAGPCARGTT